LIISFEKKRKEIQGTELIINRKIREDNTKEFRVTASAVRKRADYSTSLETPHFFECERFSRLKP